MIRISLCLMMIVKIFAGGTIRCTNIMRQAIIFDKNMPSIYIHKKFHIEENLIDDIYSAEHIFPRSYINKKDWYDMHNIIRTVNNLNVNRSNYRYTDSITNDNNWFELKHNNYVNHKQKLFIPNTVSRGFIARAILYMCKEYDYKSNKIIDKDILLNWFYSYPPCKYEKYHNEVIKKLQNTNNIFITKYNKKTKVITKFLENL
jgi:hypothetical protein